MKSSRKRTENSHFSKKAPKKKLETDCTIRLWCAQLAAIMGVGGVASFLIEQSFFNGLALCLSAIVLMSMALGFRRIELICKEIKMHLRR
jgi:hypothetical protein